MRLIMRDGEWGMGAVSLAKKAWGYGRNGTARGDRPGSQLPPHGLLNKLKQNG